VHIQSGAEARALQTLARISGGLDNAKRLGLRQSSLIFTGKNLD
jgi:hypothetical protein